MLKENFQPFIYTLFIGVMIVYLVNDPPHVVIRHKNLDMMRDDITYIESEDTCQLDEGL
jgi:hypothetical protein